MEQNVFLQFYNWIGYYCGCLFGYSCKICIYFLFLYDTYLVHHQSAALIGDFNNWNPNADIMTQVCNTWLATKSKLGCGCYKWSLIWIFMATIMLYFVLVKVCGVSVKHDSSVFYVQNEFGVWEIFLPNNADGSPPIPHGSRVKVNNLLLLRKKHLMLLPCP